jgi:RND family efflux transporter MFP subunit
MSHRRHGFARASALAVVALAAVLAGGCRKEVVRPPAPPPRVTVVLPVVKEIVESDDFNGWTAASATVEVRARVRGHIEKVHFKDGDVVGKGALLFTLDPRPFEAELEGARSKQKVFEAQLVAAQKEFARLSELVTKGGASQRQVEKAEADVGALQAQIEAQAREIDRCALDLEYSKITAPLSGRTSEAQLDEGNLVNAGGSETLLATIIAQDPIHVYFDLPERTLLVRMAAIRDEGGREKVTLAERKIPFRFALETDEGFPREGTLDFAESQVNAATGTVRVRGSVPNKGAVLVPGARVKVRVDRGGPVRAMLVPDVALMADQDRRYVLVVGDDAKVLRRDVRPGRLLDDGSRVLIPAKEGESGVLPTDRVIVQGQARARIHYPVEALDKDGKPAGPAVPAAPAPQGNGGR